MSLGYTGICRRCHNKEKNNKEEETAAKEEEEVQRG
jgi:hypothetical protein